MQVVEILLQRGANKEHRNVSDYTPLSLAASGGFVNIIKLLLDNGAEINSRTGSKLGISPLMLAAMNGHVAAVKLLLDMGSDINAQIETNRNTALTLACFQGRHEVVSLLLDRKANVEHRAKVSSCFCLVLLLTQLNSWRLVEVCVDVCIYPRKWFGEAIAQCYDILGIKERHFYSEIQIRSWQC